MEINPSHIIQNSNTIFSVLQQAQQQGNDLKETVAELTIEEKLRMGRDMIRGQVFDMLV